MGTRTKLNLQDALELRFDSDAGNNLSVREYFQALLEVLWREGEGFSGKRPFGNSDWEYELYAPLIRAGFINGELDDDGLIASVNEKEAHAFVARLIKATFEKDQNA